mmetsp:Transcript_86979/g.243836  ORF Transcript_86979/g.243836 Transcript_86979/m.243836 type:complete len:218 (-) Transcript_86979:34-687(-)
MLRALSRRPRRNRLLRPQPLPVVRGRTTVSRCLMTPLRTRVCERHGGIYLRHDTRAAWRDVGQLEVRRLVNQVRQDVAPHVADLVLVELEAVLPHRRRFKHHDHQRPAESASLVVVSLVDALDGLHLHREHAEGLHGDRGGAVGERTRLREVALRAGMSARAVDAVELPVVEYVHGDWLETRGSPDGDILSLLQLPLFQLHRARWPPEERGICGRIA